MIIKNTKLYDFLKYMQRIFLPALGALYGTLAGIWGLPFPDKIPDTVLAIVFFLGTVLEISNANYKLEQRSSTNVFMDSYEDYSNGILEDAKEDDK